MYNNPVHFHNALMQGEAELEKMYPSIYYTIYPEVVKQCNILEQTHGVAYTPNQNALNDIVENIYSNIQTQVHQSSVEDEAQTSRYGRGFFRDIISIILLGELLGRRRRRRRYYDGYRWRRPYGIY